MASSFTLVALFSLALFADIIEARKAPVVYLHAKSEALLEAIEQLVHLDSSLSNGRKVTNADCHTSEKNKSFVKDFQPRPNLSAYGEDGVKLEEKKSFIKDFEPRPNVSAYGEDGGKLEEMKSFMKDFEPIPNVSAYGEDGGKPEERTNHSSKDFEPRPNISVYGDDDVKLEEKKFFIKNFEPRPNISAYGEEVIN